MTTPTAPLAATGNSKRSVFSLVTCVLSICICTQIFKTILPLWAFNETHDAFYIAAARFVEYVPLFLLFGVFGRLIEQLRSRSLLILIASVMSLTSVLAFSPANSSAVLTLLLAAIFYAGFYLLHASRIVITKRISPPEYLGWANRCVSLAAQGLVIMGPAIGAFAILAQEIVNPSWMIICLSVVGIISAYSLKGAEPGPTPKDVSDRKGMYSAIVFWRGDTVLFVTTLLTSIYNLVDAFLWFSFFYVLKALMNLGDRAVAIALIPGILGCVIGYSLSGMVSGRFRRGFLFSYGILLLALVPMACMEKGIAVIGATVLLLSMSNIVHSTVLADLRLRLIPTFIDGRVNSWITVVIRTGNLVALASAPYVYEKFSLQQLHGVFAAIASFLFLVSVLIYRNRTVSMSL